MTSVRQTLRLTFLSLGLGVLIGASGCTDNGEAAATTTPSGRANADDTSIPVVPATSTDSAGVTGNPELTVSGENEEEADDVRIAFLGTWELHENGVRTIVVNPDGTASMHVELDFFASLIYGEDFDMELTWSIEDGVLSYTVVDGSPTETVDRVIADYGREKHYRIVAVSDDLIQLEDLEYPGTFYDWINVSPGERG